MEEVELRKLLEVGFRFKLRFGVWVIVGKLLEVGFRLKLRVGVWGSGWEAP